MFESLFNAHDHVAEKFAQFVEDHSRCAFDCCLYMQNSRLAGGAFRDVHLFLFVICLNALPWNAK